MPSSRSSGSKPVITIGTRTAGRSARTRSHPITVQTCPGPRNPCTRLSGAWRSAVIIGGTRTCETSTLKFSSRRRRAIQTAIALGGAVVSKPIAKKTTWRSGCAAARFTASSGE